MHVHFRCLNQLTDSQGNTNECGRALRAPRDKAGRYAKCPQCGERVKIPAASQPAIALASGLKDIPRSPQPSDDQLIQLRQDDFDDPVLDGASRSGALQVANSNARSTDKKPSHSQNFLPLDQVRRCRKCGNRTDARGFCKNCKSASPTRDRSADEPIGNIKIKASGFQLWITQIVSEGVPPAVLAVLIHILTVAFLVCAVLVIGTVTSGLWFVFTLGFVSALAFLYGGVSWKCWHFKNAPYAELAWFQRPFWDGFLWWCRQSQWSNSKGKNRVIITNHESDLNDQKLDKLKDLKDAAVLDLEGTSITDEAFRFFYRMDKLQCLVLKGTAVSHEAVFRLHQARPKLWIWY